MSSATETSAAEADYLAELKAMLDAAREEARARHRSVNGLEAVALYSASIQRLFHHHMEATAKRLGCEALREGLALIAIGGFGRGEMVFHSDIDFCFLTERQPTPEEEAFIKAVLYPLWNLRLDLGYCVHSIRDALAALGEDLNKTTAFLETRHIWGEVSLWEELTERLHAKLRKNHLLWYVESLRAEIKTRHVRHGDTVFLLEPDIKNSRGALRDLHYILWIAFANHGVSNLRVLVENGLISESELTRLLAAWSFLLDVRNSLHLSENRRVDKLTIERQISVAKTMGMESTDASLAEESLMRQYYDHASLVERIGRRVMDSALRHTPGTQESISEVALPRPAGRDFWARSGRIWVEERDLNALDADKFWTMRLFEAAARDGHQIPDATLRHIEDRLPRIDDAFRKSPVARDIFLSILRNPGNIANTLRAMNRCGFLSRFLPEFACVHNLPRIDHYHQFTVDEHLIRSVGVCEELLREAPPEGMEHVSEAAKEVLRIDLLHFALLLHDVGKGEGRAHVIRGMHTAQRISERMDLRPVEREILRSLIANHQKMGHMALRRDIEDPLVARELAEAAANPEMLRMLYVHSICDLRAVSAESWNAWRGRLMMDLFERTLDALRGVHRERTHRQPRTHEREQIWAELSKAAPGHEWQRGDLDHFLGDMPERYLASVLPVDMVKHFLLSTELVGERRIVHRVDSYEGSSYEEITFVARDAPGLFSNLCGAMASKGFNILSAQIYTAASGEAVDIFQVQVPPVIRPSLGDVLNRICILMTRILQTGEKPNWSKSIDKSSVFPMTPDRLNLRPPRVDIGNETSSSHTVIEVRAPDRPGLLSEITAVFDTFSINIDLAFIATESYQVVDVFYVTDLEASKLQEGPKLEELRAALMDTIMKRIEFKPETGKGAAR